MSKKQESPCFVWDWTIYVETEMIPHTDVIDTMNALGKKWAFQLEEGTKLKKKHYQCRISLNEKMRQNELANELPFKAYITRTSNKNKGNLFYVIKSDTRIEGPWRDTPKYRQEMPFQWVGILENPRPFQSQILQWAEQKDDRRINLIFDKTGNSGKSSFANRLEFEGKCYQITASKNTNEMCADLCDELEAANDDRPGLIFVDMERAADQDNMKSIFAAVERIKGGKVTDRRYRLRKSFFFSPSVVMYMNQLPYITALSSDRWRLWEMNKDFTLSRIDGKRFAILRQQVNDAEDETEWMNAL